MINIPDKLPHVSTTIFTVMSRMAQEHNAINLSQGYPDFPVPEALVERLHHYALRGENQYPPMHGVAYLREQIANKVRNCYHAELDPEAEITITSGATEALFVAINAIVSRGDEVIVFDPAYDSYDPAVTLAGGTTIHIPMTEDYRIDWQLTRNAVTKNTRAIIMNSPHNPSGTTIGPEDIEQLVQIVDGSDIAVISDEVYEHILFDDKPHQSLVSHPALRKHAFVISSFGKTYHATGWKVGYCLANAQLTTEFRKVHQFVTFTTHTPTQWAIADYLEHHAEHHETLGSFYQNKRDLFAAELVESAFNLLPCEGTYFQLADYSALSDLPDTEFANYLTQQVGVAAIPISVFHAEPPNRKHIRFCFAKEDDTLRQATRLLREHEF